MYTVQWSMHVQRQRPDNRDASKILHIFQYSEIWKNYKQNLKIVNYILFELFILTNKLELKFHTHNDSRLLGTEKTQYFCPQIKSLQEFEYFCWFIFSFVHIKHAEAQMV